jgi:predicted negative regulator of RcsB-dependent stress response
MARLLVVDPDPRIRGGLVRLLGAAGHVTDEFESVDAARAVLAEADLIFVSAGPGGSLIDPSMAVFGAEDVHCIVWTGPVAAMIQPAVDAGVGVDCLELPTRLPALKGVLGRHLKRTLSDRWAGDAFLHQIRGKGDRFPPCRVLFLVHRLSASGRLQVGSTEITMQQGKLAEARGIPTVGEGEGLMAAITTAIGQGQSPDAAMHDTAMAVVKALVQLDADDLEVAFTVESQRSSIVLPDTVPRLLAKALKELRPPDVVKTELAARPSRRVRLAAPDDSPETAWGLSPVALRMVRAATRASNLGDLLAGAGGPERDAVWESLDYLLHIGVLQLDDEKTQLVDGRQRPEEVFSDIVIEAVEAKPTDPRVVELQEKAREIESTPPWELFEVENPADINVTTVAERFREASRQFHPDRFTAEGKDIQYAAAGCFSALGDARDKFDDEAFRDEVRARIIAKREGRVYVSEADRKKAKMLYTQGDHSARRKDWTSALSSLEQSRELDPTAWETHLQWALARWKSGRMKSDEAIVELEKVVAETGRGRAEVKYQLGEAFLASQRETEAYACFQKTVEIDPDHVGARRRLRMRARRSEQGGESTGKTSGGLRGMFGWGRKKG